MAIKNRTDLKAYFVKNAIPTEGNFADLIDSQLNQAPVGGDGVFKPDGEALSVIAAPGDQKRVLRLYANYPAANPDWMISLKPAQDPANSATTQPGFGVTDGAGNTRLFVEAGSGRIGVGTNTPQFALDVVGGARIQGPLGVTVTGPIVPSVGNSETNGIQFPKDPGLGSGDRAFIRYFVESGETTKLLIGNNNDADDRISLYQMSGERLTVYNGCVGINNVTPGAALDVMAISNNTWNGWFEAIRFSRGDHSAITFPSGKLLFGLHSDRNFYFADTNAGRYVMTVSGATGNVSIVGGLTVGADLEIEGSAGLGWARSTSDFNAPLRSGMYQYPEPVGRVPDTSHSWVHMIAVRHSNATNHHQLQIASSYAENDRLFFRKIARSLTDNGRPGWNEIATVTNGILKQEGWSLIAFLNGWSQWPDGRFGPPGFFKDSCGIVHLRGLVKPGTLNEYIFQLPVGYRPQSWHLFVVMSSTGPGRLDMATDGGLTTGVGGPSGWVSLDSISFRAA